MRYLRILWTFFRFGALSELQYRANFVVQFFQSIVGLATGLAGLAVVYSHTTTLGGWRRDQLLAVLGVYYLVGGALSLVIRPSMQRFMEDVRVGTLDYVLVKPEDAQFLVSIREIQLWKLVDIVLGVLVLTVAVIRLSTGIGPAQALEFVAALLCGATIVYSFWMVLAALTFWIVRVDNILVIFLSMYEAGRWPVTIYPSALRWTLTFLVPVAFAITIPAEALTGRLTGATLAGAVALAGAFLAGSRWFWRVGVRRYSGASA